jgi:transcriptional regulator with XRE-family HTH domain
MMARRIDLKNLADYRRTQGLNQSAFWSRYGVTQSGGSRYESGRDLPTPVAILVWLRETGRLSDADLEAARKGVAKGTARSN